MDAADDFNMYFKSKRDQYLVEIRKQKNEHLIKEKRLKMTVPNTDESDFVTETKPQISSTEMQEKLNTLAASFLEALKASELDAIANLAESIRRAISEDDDPPLQELLNTGVTEYIAKLLDPQYYQYEKIIIECSWIMANIASGKTTFTIYAVNLGIISKALDLFEHPSYEVKENAVWIIANVAGESLEYRDLLLEGGIVPQIELLLQACKPEPKLLAQITWLMSDLSRGKPYPRFERIAPFLKWIQNFLNEVDDKEVQDNLFWVLSYISDGDNDQMQYVLDLNICQKVIASMNKPSLQTKIPALRTVGNLLTGDDQQVGVLLEHGVIDALVPLMDSSNKLVRREACWTLSNLMAGSWSQIEHVFQFRKGMIIKKLFKMIENDDFVVAKESTYCLTNACYSGTLQQIAELVDQGIIEMLIGTLKENGDAKLLKACLGALEAILDEYDTYKNQGAFESNEILERIAQCGGYTIIENLQSHVDNGVYKAVAKIIEDYFDCDS